MLDLTPIVRPWFESRLRRSLRFVSHGESVQREQLDTLLQTASRTEIGTRYSLGERGMSYSRYRERVPLHTYEQLRPAIMRMMRGERDVLWPGVTRNYAQSSGTADGRSKYVPVTTESFHDCHYRGSSYAVAHYLNLNPASRMFSGKGVILGGSFTDIPGLPRRVRVGDLSANLISKISPIVNLVRVPDKRTALIDDWAVKLPAIVERSRRKNITNISGVPSWFLNVLKEIIKREGADTIHDVWPNLEVFFHGGINFEPYRDEYARICDMDRMHFVDTYNASEGFFAVQSSWDSPAMMLLLDVGVFYEFIPIDEVTSSSPRTLPLWEIEQGKTYELVITANNGLWRYRIGDTVLVESTAPVKIKIAGRTMHYINAFGEELMVHNADEAIARTCRDTGATIANYTAAPVYSKGDSHGRHQWLIEFCTPPDDLEAFAGILDEHLKEENSDYEAKRAHDIFLDRPAITIAREGLFDQWLGATGKLGGQRKIPRLCNNRHIIDELLEMNG